MSELPPQVPGQQLEKARLYPDKVHKIVERTLEEGEHLLEAEGGGRRTTESIVECDGHEHTRFKEQITYDAANKPGSFEELEREVIGPCDGKHA
jgi:hypothetical protein